MVTVKVRVWIWKAPWHSAAWIPESLKTTPSWTQTSFPPYEELPVLSPVGRTCGWSHAVPIGVDSGSSSSGRRIYGRPLERPCLRTYCCVVLTRSQWGLLAVQIPAGSLLGTLWVSSKSSPVLFLSPTGHWAAAAPWLQAGARRFRVLVHLPQRAAPEQSLCLLAAGKEGDLYRRQAQVPSCISLKKVLARKEGWEGCSYRALCFVLFLLCPFLTS